jgi:hypothetical protein
MLAASTNQTNGVSVQEALRGAWRFLDLEIPSQNPCGNTSDRGLDCAGLARGVTSSHASHERPDFMAGF